MFWVRHTCIHALSGTNWVLVLSLVSSLEDGVMVKNKAPRIVLDLLTNPVNGYITIDLSREKNIGPGFNLPVNPVSVLAKGDQSFGLPSWVLHRM